MSNTTQRSWAESTAVPDISTSITGRAAALIDAWRWWRTYRRDVARLQAMDARMLRDIGLTRSEIGHAVRFGRYNG
jgi:uncharacterized protein YjiS (DUF1127 family)